ncbi:malonate--CoA ligase [Pseudaestuariivita atlantica]|uniref:malonate--CoA ligase n=1 Tax=Pseudaestuariivita atlantica TaxID=1317121 RepID=UPI0009E52FF8|nr:malonyl-CoA synthase [Pseudaestuariivita atlantica]
MTNHLIEALGLSARPDAPLARMPDGATVTYGAFHDGAARIAALLAAEGVQPGDRVAAQVSKSLTALQLYVGTVMAGGVFLPLNTGYTSAELQHFITDADPRVFVCDPDAKADIAALTPASLMTLNASGGGSLADGAAAQPAGFDPVPRGPDDLAAILYTSGTTGKPKGAMLSHGNLADNARTLAEYWRFTADDVLIHALPIFHTHGLFVATNVTLVAGGQMIFQPGFDAQAILDALPHATALMGVPTFYTRLLQQDGLAEAARGMRLFVSGSAPLLAETHVQWEAATGHRILERYGMTETNMNTSNPYDGERRAGTVGFPLPGVDLRLTDGKGTPVADGDPGIVEVRGPNVFKGYWNLPEKTAEELLADGFFVTGDIGRIDADGYLHIIGRAKDLVISGGYNVYPKEVEVLIDDVPGVVESAVIGVPHPDFGEAVVAIVVGTSSDPATPDAIAAAIAPDLARYKQPKLIEMVDALPRNTMGKVQKNVLRETYGNLFT